jgi:hypothetical protein
LGSRGKMRKLIVILVGISILQDAPRKIL